MTAGVDTWPELVALMLVLLLGTGGIVQVVMARHAKRADARSERSVELHRGVFDDAVERLKAELSDKIERTMDPITDRQISYAAKLDEIGKDVRGLRRDVGELRGADREIEQRVTKLERGR